MARIHSQTHHVKLISGGTIVSIRQIDGSGELQLIDSEGSSIYLTAPSIEVAQLLSDALKPTRVSVERYPDVPVVVTSIKDIRPTEQITAAWDDFRSKIKEFATVETK